MGRKKQLNWLQLMTLLFTAWISPVASQQGFLSIDCGSDEDYTDNTTGISWETDALYVSTGEKANNITVRSSYTIVNRDQVGTLRFFDEPRSRDCYVLPVRPQQTYLVRSTFFYGDWMEDGNSTFNIYLNGTRWLHMDFTSNTLDRTYSYEAIVYSPGSELNFCLVREQGPSFISTLEIRMLESGMYSAAVTPTNNVYLHQFRRTNCGASQLGPRFVRYPQDIYDRIWNTPDSSFDNATLIKNLNISPSSSTSAPDRPPLVVMEDAWVYYNSNVLWYYFDFGEPVNSKIYVTAYFQELDGNASATNVRGMTYTINDKFIRSFNSSDEALEIYGPVQDITDRFVNISFLQANWSSLRPILNAVEIYFVYDVDTSQTAVADLRVLSALQTRLNLTDWTGDPCVPVPYDWMSCTADNINPTIFRVTELSLEDKGINGSIPPEILNLTSLTRLSLNNNKLTGSIPDMSSLPHLEALYLQNNYLSGDIPSSLGADLANLSQLHVDNNNLSGSVPVNLVTKPGLNLSYANNPDLVCDFSACNLTPFAPANQTSSTGSNIGAVVGGILGGLAALVILSGIIWFLCTRKERATSSIIRAIGQAKNSNRVEMSITRHALAGSVTPLSLQEVSDATKRFSRKIGEGSFGPVYYGKLPNGQEVAVKVKSAESRQGFNEFLNEVELLSRIHHRNLVSLVGYCEEGEQQILIYVYVPNGTLRDYLYGDKSERHLDWRTRLDIALNSARGLEYLHTDCNPRIIHRDVKSSNILLDDNWVAKVADFGISKLAPEGTFSGVDTVLKGTPGYIDPEYFITQRLTQKSDVYSFGVVLLEMISGRHPHISELPDGTSGTLIQSVQSLVRDGNVADIFDPSMKGEFNYESVMKVVYLALSSINPVTAKRPDMSQVVRGITQAIELELFSETTLKDDYVTGLEAIPEGKDDSGSHLLQSLPGSDVPDEGTTLQPR